MANEEEASEYREYENQVNEAVSALLSAFRLTKHGVPTEASRAVFETVVDTIEHDTLLGVLTALVAVVDHDHPGQTPKFNIPDDELASQLGDENG